MEKIESIAQIQEVEITKDVVDKLEEDLAKTEKFYRDKVSSDTAEVRWIDRDLSWLKFNERVLAQVKRKYVPFHEKLAFIGIADSNLSEFIAVRFSEMYQHRDDNKNAKKEYSLVLEQIAMQKEQIGMAFKTLVSKLDIFGKNVESKKVVSYFDKNVFPALTPITVESNKEIPKFNVNDLNLFIRLRDDDDSNEDRYCFLQIPEQLGRVFHIEENYHTIEELLIRNLKKIFTTKTIAGYLFFKVTKSYNEEIDQDTHTSIIDRVNEVIKKREENNIIYLQVYQMKSTKKMLKDLIKLLKVPKKHVFVEHVEKDSIKEFALLGFEFLKDKPFKKVDVEEDSWMENPEIVNAQWKTKFRPIVPDELFGVESMFDYLDEEDLVVHHPYETYELVVSFLHEAAHDPNTISIKQTLYRVSSEKSPIIKALCDAARNGIKVTVMLELLARFDEKQNVRLINKLKDAGCTIVYSLNNIKTHCKICLVTKATKKGIVSYSHMGTGNYNENSAKVYTDISYFTSKDSIAHDLNSIFNMITGFSEPDKLNKLSYSPKNLREKIVSEILEASNNATEETPATVNIKVNAISDEQMVDLIETVASENPHITFNIICRGICSLVPVSDNIKIKSVIGRFLEHSRIYAFEYASKKRVYISTADLLTRNLDKRIETLIPITDNDCKKKILNIFDSLMRDVANTSWLYKIIKYSSIGEEDEDYMAYNAQNDFIVK